MICDNRHFFEAKTAIDEQSILSDLPTDLRHEVSTFLISDLMKTVTLFRDLEPSSWSRILPLLRPCRFEGGSLICSQGEHCTEAFIVLEGEMRAVTVVDPSVGPDTLAKLGLKHESSAVKLKRRTSNRVIASVMTASQHHRSSSIRGGLRLRQYFSDQTEKKGSSDSLGGGGSDPPAASPLREQPKKISEVEHEDDTDMSMREKSSPSSPNTQGNNKKKKNGNGDGDEEEEEEKDPPTALEVLDKFAQSENAHCRVLKQGGMINTLCLMHVWEKCLETVVATENCECYAINAVEFRTIFTADDDDFKDMRERVVYVSRHKPCCVYLCLLCYVVCSVLLVFQTLSYLMCINLVPLCLSLSL
jgi:hypothetical protein